MAEIRLGKAAAVAWSSRVVQEPFYGE